MIEALEIPIHENERIKLSRYIEEALGITMPPHKKVFLKARLLKRLKRLNFNSFSKYYDYLTSPEGRKTEIDHFIDNITTNKTDFFREDDHFDYLSEIILPELSMAKQKKISLWSAPCSTGEEPYTLAMVLEDYKRKNDLSINYDILGTDISKDALNKAYDATYEKRIIEPIPLTFKRKFLLRHKYQNDIFRVSPALRVNVRFRQLNLLNESFNINGLFDVIFCRNVLIYFDRDNQNKTINNLFKHLKPGGYLFLGHSENIFTRKKELIKTAPSVYKRIK